MKKYKVMKYLLTVICMLAAGICYSCGRQTSQADLDGQVLMDLQTGKTIGEAEEQNGLILVETEAGKESEEQSEPQPVKETLPQQTESVRFYVHICGEVKNPGVYEMEPGSRIFQAVELAGGFTQEAAKDYLNMAQETKDGMKIMVPSKEEVGIQGDAEAGEPLPEKIWIQMPESTDQKMPENQASSQKVNLNTAEKEELMTLTGIGEAKAEAIIRYRKEQGPFESIEEIMNISGIKEAAFEKIKDQITV